MEVLAMIGQFLLAIMLLVGVHELGHMVAAKLFGMRVEKYSIGFPPKLFSFRKGETEYSLGAIPLGGFVKISGMVDESLDTESMDKDPEPYEFRAKPAWQRLIVMMGGILVNIFTGILIFIFVLYSYGERYYSPETINEHGIQALSLAEDLGMQTGDKIIAVNGRPYEKFPDDLLAPEVLLGEESTYTIRRGDSTFQVTIPEGFVGELNEKKDSFLMPLYPFEVGKVEPGMPAAEAGLKEGDDIVEAAGEEIRYFNELPQILQDHKGSTVEVKVMRDGSLETLNIPVTEEGVIGFHPVILLPRETRNFSFLESVPRGTEQAFSVVINTAKGLGQVVTGKVDASDSVAGPFQIAREYGPTWNWGRFWTITGLISMVLAFMNFLPIPALDGGHVMFLLYEMIAGRKPSDKFLENAQKVGMILLLTLMVFVFGNDIYKLFIQ